MVVVFEANAVNALPKPYERGEWICLIKFVTSVWRESVGGKRRRSVVLAFLISLSGPRFGVSILVKFENMFNQI